MAGGGADGAIPVADDAVDDLRKLLARLTSDVRRQLLALDTEDGTDALSRSRTALANSARVLRQVQATLEDKGFGVVVDVTQRRAVEAAEAAVAGAVPVDAQREIDAIVSGQTKEVAAVFAAAADEMRQAINAGVTSGGSLADLVDKVAERLDVAISKAQSAVDAAVMAAGRRAVMADAAESGVDLVYVYVGPEDAKNRPFCAALVGKAVTAERMKTLDNGMGLDPADFCGGYGCRHSWAPVPRADAGVEVLS